MNTLPTTAAPRKSRSRGWWLLLLVGGVALGAGLYTGKIPNPLGTHTPKANASAEKPAENSTTVKLIRPKRESSVAMTIDQVASVEPYYQAELRARASGIVKRVHRDIGDRVQAGDILVEIDVPDIDQDVAKCDAMILQRQQELKVSQAKFKDAKAAKEVAAATIRQRQADVIAATATRDFRKRKFNRFQELAKSGTVVGNLVEEEEREYLASEAVVTSTNANVDRAKADFSESESKVEAAAADIDLKQAQIEVARKDLERAKAIADYSKVLAPFAGVIVRRNVDPGSFVQNATTGSSETLIAVARLDLVTVSAKFPDNVAALVNEKTMASIQFADLPGLNVTSKITRFSPTVLNADRTMRVEIDLFNGTESEYQLLLEAIKVGGPNRPTKGASDPIPVHAQANQTAIRRLVPGMLASIKLGVGGFGESYVLPSAAVYTRSGTSYVLLVEQGRTKQVPVRVQFNDGKTVRVGLQLASRDTNGNVREGLRELTGQEEIVATRQLEIGDGTAVQGSASDW